MTAAAGRARRGRLQPFVDRLPLVAYVEHLDGTPVHVSPQLERLLGIPVAAWTSAPEPLARLLDPDDRERVLAARRRQAETGEPLALEYRLLTADGRRPWIRDESIVVDGEREGFLLDVSDRAASEDELRRSLSVLRATLESTADGILVVDAFGRIGGFNRRFCELFGIPPELARGVDGAALELAPELLVAPEGLLGLLADLQEEPDGQLRTVELADGRVLERSSLPQELDGRVVGRVWSFRDVTERRRAEERLRRSQAELHQAQKMEAVGRLAGGIAHDFNNLLTAIGGYAQLVLDELPPDEPLAEDVGEIVAAAERAAELTRHLLAFSRRQVLQRRPVDLNALVDGVGRLLRRLIPEAIRTETRLDPDLWTALADPGQIEQVLVNLAVNARDAMPGGGTLTISTANVRREGAELVRLTVADTGTGMPPEVAANVFEPFFTTKEAGKGTGLGLSTVHGIVTQSGGFVTLETEPGAGAAFHVHLPRATADAERADGTPAGDEAVPGGSGTILLVEDDPATRALARRALVRHGYRVLEAADAGTALDLFRRHRDAVSLVLTDIVLPGLDGTALLAQIRELAPATPALTMSGYAEVAGASVETDDPFLPKPFTPAELARAVRDAIERPQQAGGAADNRRR